MILLADVGNTKIKWALLHNGALDFVGARFYLEQDFLTLLSELWDGLATPEYILISNVAGSIIQTQLSQWVTQKWGMMADFAETSKQAFGVINGYAQPEKFGVDRWLSLIAARKTFLGQNIAIISCGTAITLDVLDSQGKHHGGLIAPGISLMRNSLNELISSSLWSHDYEKKSDQWLATNTEDAIVNGSLTMALGFINQAIAKLRGEFKQLEVLITGGDAGSLLSFLNTNVHHRPYLVLEGLAVLAQEKK